MHHVNEIAQSRALYNEIPANFWMYKEHLQLGGVKMAKSSGKFITLEDLKKEKYPPEVFKFFVLSSHYRSRLEFSIKALNQARENLHKIRNFISDYQTSISPKIDSQSEQEEQVLSKQLETALQYSPTPHAVSLVWWVHKPKTQTSFVQGIESGVQIV